MSRTIRKQRHWWNQSRIKSASSWHLGWAASEGKDIEQATIDYYATAAADAQKSIRDGHYNNSGGKQSFKNATNRALRTEWRVQKHQIESLHTYDAATIGLPGFCCGECPWCEDIEARQDATDPIIYTAGRKVVNYWNFF